MSPYPDPRPSTAATVVVALVTVLLAALTVFLVTLKATAE